MFIADQWKDYELLDCGDGEKLERWGKYILRRPDPQAIWPKILWPEEWNKADAHYNRSGGGGGNWEFKKQLPESWVMKYKDLLFYVKTMGFKHTGIFPEQAVNWEWMMKKIRSMQGPLNVLNLFAYTGAATVACALAGAAVCHVDAAKGMVNMAHENLKLSGFENKPVRWIVDDVLKFVKREIKRGRKYEGIIMDPPSFGRGPQGEVWKFENEIVGLIERCSGLMSDKPLFFLLNSYTTGFAPVVLENVLKLCLGKKIGGKIMGDYVGIKSRSGLILPCGVSVRWENP